MLYVQQSLAPDEELVHIGQFHWMYTVGAFFSIIWSLFFGIAIIIIAIKGYTFWGVQEMKNATVLESIQILHPGIKLLAFFVFIFGLLKFAHMMVVKATTEIAITNNRLIFKRGLVARQVGEINIDRIEGVNVLQTIMGRIFNYGRIMVRGMGV
ncbi:MAG: PH domain-containing protein, partial [Alphaproteobacteria bacterium]|nr:PH domain-containing protein [Alphaproteobacteria bacterium]